MLQLAMLNSEMFVFSSNMTRNRTLGADGVGNCVRKILMRASMQLTNRLCAKAMVFASHYANASRLRMLCSQIGVSGDALQGKHQRFSQYEYVCDELDGLLRQARCILQCSTFSILH